MAFQNSRYRVQQAQKWLDTLVREEIATTGANKIHAIRAVANRIGVTAAFIEHIERGRAKTIDPDKYDLVQEGFCASMESKAMSLMHAAQLAQQTGAGHGRLIEIETCLRRMLDEIARSAARVSRAVTGGN